MDIFYYFIILHQLNLDMPQVMNVKYKYDH
jgi:hypothetical protein